MPTFHLHVAQEVKVETEWELVDFKLEKPFCFIFVQLFFNVADSLLA